MRWETMVVLQVASGEHLLNQVKSTGMEERDGWGEVRRQSLAPGLGDGEGRRRGLAARPNF